MKEIVNEHLRVQLTEFFLVVHEIVACFILSIRLDKLVTRRKCLG